MQEQVSRQFVGIDRHRRRSVIVRLDQAGKVLGTVRVGNDPVEFALAMAEAGEGPEVALEATYGYVRHEAPYDRVGRKGPTCDLSQQAAEVDILVGDLHASAQYPVPEASQSVRCERQGTSAAGIEG